MELQSEVQGYQGTPEVTVSVSSLLRFLANLPEFKCQLKVKPVFDK